MPKRIRTPQYIPVSKRGRRTKIYIPQFQFKPLRLTRRLAVRTEELRVKEWWFVLHRRGFRRRPTVGENPLEARAVPKEVWNGTLPERIIYAYLVEKLHLQPEVDFIAQSALEGGRQEVGGIVADFVFPYHKFVIQVQGFHHNLFIWRKRDEEQKLDFALKGWQYVEIFEDTIYNEYALEEFMRRLFALPQTAGGSGLAFGSLESEYSTLELIMKTLGRIEVSLTSQFGA